MILVVNAFIGVIMYAYFHDCDPLKAGVRQIQFELYCVYVFVNHLPGRQQNR